MEDYHVAKFVQYHGRELGLFAIYDGHLGDKVPAYLQKNLFHNILKEVGFRSELSFHCVCSIAASKCCFIPYLECIFP